MDFGKRILEVFAKHRLPGTVTDLIDDLEVQLSEARELAQHLLECARGNDVVRQDLPDWLEDEEEDEEAEEDDSDGWVGR